MKSLAQYCNMSSMFQPHSVQGRVGVGWKVTTHTLQQLITFSLFQQKRLDHQALKPSLNRVIALFRTALLYCGCKTPTEP